MNAFLLDSEKIDEFSRQGDEESIYEMLNIAEEQLKQGNEVIYGYNYFDISNNNIQRTETILCFRKVDDFQKWREEFIPKFLNI